MDFIIPFDQIGVSPPGPWENAAPSSGVEGSIPNADFFPAVQTEILNVQDEAGLTRNAADFTQLLQAIRTGRLTAFVDTGAADALIVTPRTAYTALAFGVPIQVLKGAAGNATTTPTLAANGLTRQIVKEDGTALAVGDLPAGSLFSVISDGSKLRVVGLRKSDAAAAAAASTTINATTLSYINAASPIGWTHLFANQSGLVDSDISVTPTNTIVITTGQFTGAQFVTGNVTIAMRNTDTSGFFLGFACQVFLNDITAGSPGVLQSSYLGASATSTSTAQIQIPFSLPFTLQNLNPAKEYTLSIVARKAASYGPVQTYDATVNGYHNGTNS